MDRPVNLRTEPELDLFVQRHLRRNVTANVAEGALFWLGLSFLSSTTILPLFVSKLTSSTLPLGLIAMLGQGGWLLPQLLAAHWVERMPRRKPAVILVSGLLERLPVWLLVLLGLNATRWPSAILVLFLLTFAFHTLGGGFIGPAWQDLIARIIPVRRRGRFWGLTNAVGTGTGFAGSILSAWLLVRYPFPANFAMIFGLAAAAFTLGWLPLFLIREPEVPVPSQGKKLGQFLTHLPGLLHQDRPFRRYLLARSLLSLGLMGLGFVTVAAVRRWQVTDSVVGYFTGAQLIGMASGSLLFGALADRLGHKLSLEWAALIYTAAFLLAWLAPAPVLYYPVYLLLGAGQGAVFLSGMFVVMEFAEPARRPTYIGISNTVVGLVSMAGPLLASGLAAVRYDLVFAISAAISLVGYLTMHWWVQDPRWADRSSSLPSGQPLDML